MRMKTRHLVGVLGALAVGGGTILVACTGDDGSPETPTKDAAVDTAPTPTPTPTTTTPPPPDASVPDAKPSTDFTKSISAGGYTACALSNTGRVICWGDNSESEMLVAPKPGSKCAELGGDSVDCDPRLPTELRLPFPVTELGVGHLSTCAIFADGATKKVGCWGNNTQGELSSATDAGVSSTVVFVPLPAQPKRISAGRYFKLVELEDGSIWGWGDNRYGQFGGKNLSGSPAPEKVFPFGDGGVDAGSVVDFGTSALDTFIVTTQGMWGSGDNTAGEQMIPNPPTDEVHTFTKMPVPDSGAPIASLHKGTARAYGQCYLNTLGEAWCWGDNSTGQVGSTAPGASTMVPVKVALPAGKKVVSISEGGGNVCASLDDGTVFCWGDNQAGQNGQPASGDFTPPTQVAGITNAASVAVGYWRFSCALSSDHKTFCWGDGSYGQLGKATDGGLLTSTKPVEVPIVW